MKIFIFILQKGRFYKQFNKYGFEYNYEVLGEIFNSSVATGKLSHAFTKEPLTLDEEKELEEDFFQKVCMLTLILMLMVMSQKKQVKERKPLGLQVSADVKRPRMQD